MEPIERHIKGPAVDIVPDRGVSREGVLVSGISRACPDGRVRG
jgi:hypothetical protein